MLHVSPALKEETTSPSCTKGGGTHAPEPGPNRCLRTSWLPLAAVGVSVLVNGFI